MIENTNNNEIIIEISKNLKKKQIELIKIMSEDKIKIDSSISILSESPKELIKNSTKNVKTRIINLLYKLEKQEIVKSENNIFSLTELGQNIAEYLEKNQILNKEKRSSSRQLQKQEVQKKRNEFLELYKQGLSYQDIGNKHQISRERVRQILIDNPTFHEYREEQELAKIQAQEEKEKQAEENFYERSIAFLYPEKVDLLWDYEKNGNLQPDEVIAGSVSQYIWLKCPLDRYSWKKKPNDITTSWSRYGTSGCPKCAGKTKKIQQRPKLKDAYPDFVQQYWDYEKNDELNIYPEKVKTGSNKKAWFKCSVDGNEWERIIHSMVAQNWSKGNGGCSVCNGTQDRKKSKWTRANPVAVDFSEEVAKYWLYEKNNELKLNPNKLTTGSKKKAWFKCPLDQHEWEASITAIAKTSWKKGNSGCPACRGWIAAETTSLIALYPEYIQQYWDYEKND